MKIMAIEDIKVELPLKENKIKKFYNNCKSRKKFIEFDPRFAEAHLRKARHDLFRAIKEFEDNCWDWTVVKAYYAIHHAGNYILLKKEGKICKDHSCLIIALQYHELISYEVSRELEKLHESLSNALGLDLAFQLRKISQYDVIEWEKITKQDAEVVINIAKKILEIAENA